MICRENWAYIKSGTVKGVGSYTLGSSAAALEVAHSLYGNDATVVEVSQYPVQEGDLYENSKFYRVSDTGARTEIQYVPTETEQIDSLNETVDDLLIEILGG